MVHNLLRHKENILRFPKQSDDGDFTYKGLTFKMEEIVYEAHSEWNCLC